MASDGPRRRVARVVLWLAPLLLAAGLVAAWWVLPRAIELAAERAARGTPLAPLSLRVTRVGVRGLELRDVAAGPDAALRADRIALHYTPRGLLERRLERLEVADWSLRLEPGGGLPGAPAAGGDADTAPGLSALERLRELRLPVAALSLVGGRVEAPPHPALAVTAELAQREGGRVALDARLTALGGALDVSVEGSHVLADARGDARVRVAPIVFREGGLQPRDLLPPGWAPEPGPTRVAGEVSLESRPSWSPEGLRIPLDASLRALAFHYGEIVVEGLEGDLRLEQLSPPATPAGQRIDIRRIEAGTPVRDVHVVFQLRPDGRLAIEDLVLHALGGTARTRGVLDARAPRQRLVWSVEADLARLLEMLDVPGLGGSGRLAGDVPVEVHAGGPSIRAGHLAAANGRIRYAPGATANALPDVERAALVRSVLENFHYEALEATLNGDMDALALDLQLRGANPDIYEGHPVEFNLHLEYPPLAFVRSLALFTEVSRALTQRLTPADAR